MSVGWENIKVPEKGVRILLCQQLNRWVFIEARRGDVQHSIPADFYLWTRAVFLRLLKKPPLIGLLLMS